ncbi:hypothetical protein PFISCL1PPCAC_20907, partial [Pristionchus fissidentatus]
LARMFFMHSGPAHSIISLAGPVFGDISSSSFCFASSFDSGFDAGGFGTATFGASGGGRFFLHETSSVVTEIVIIKSWTSIA